ncbi:MAG TPA: hypothetical protein VMT00_04715 [Thermoanaerobaculia bacterium]|nr:hypothetical protein [Thermoanaerobaculia bacterium]
MQQSRRAAFARERVACRAALATMLLVLLTASASCRRGSQTSDEQVEWLAVLDVKRAYQASAAGNPESLAAKQAYADAVADFLERHPSNARARQVYAELELEFARGLERSGRIDEAIQYYQNAVLRDPDDDSARSDLARALSLRFVGRDALAAIVRGMTREEVAARIGAPRPGWRRTLIRRGRESDCWYYRGENNAVAAVCFREGRVVATDYPQSVPVATVDVK